MSGPALSRMDGFGEDRTELIGLVGDGVEASGRQQFRLSDKPEPRFGLT